MKDIRNRILEPLKNNDALNRIIRLNNLDENTRNPFTRIKKITNIPYLQMIQYKALFNIHPTKHILVKWGVVDDNRCESCGIKETNNHVIIDCESARTTLQNINSVLNVNGQRSITRTEFITLEGLKPDLATFIIKIKGTLLQQESTNRRAINTTELKNIWEYQKNLERVISQQSKASNKHLHKWTTPFDWVTKSPSSWVTESSGRSVSQSKVIKHTPL